MQTRRTPDAAPGAVHGHPFGDVRYLVCFGAVIGWVTWAYLRIRPPTSVINSVPQLKNYGPYAYGHLAYSDLVSLYHLRHLANHALPYVHVAIEYPVLTGFYMWTAAWVPGVQGYFLVSCLGLLACALGSFHLLYRMSPRYATIFAFSPLLLVYSVLNWDMFAIVLMLGGWTLYRRKMYEWAGVVLALAVCAKFFPFVLLIYGVVALVAQRSPEGRRHARRMTAYAVATGVVLNLPFAIVSFRNWSHFFEFNAKRGGSAGLFVALHLDTGWSTAAIDAVSVAVVLLVMVLLARQVLRGASPTYAAAVALATLMLVNKVFSPQYMLWVLVFALLAQWTPWTIAVITVAGLVDFVNAMTTLHLLSAHDPDFGWYFRWIFPLDRGLVLSAIFCGAVTSVWQARTSAAGEPPGASRAPDDVDTSFALADRVVPGPS